MNCVTHVHRTSSGRLLVSFTNRTTTTHARLVAAIKIGRPLTSGEHVHHMNHDPGDDRFENLDVISVEEHTLLHAEARRRARWPEKRSCPRCGCDQSERTTGCGTCCVRHRRRQLRGEPFVPGRAYRRATA